MVNSPKYLQHVWCIIVPRRLVHRQYRLYRHSQCLPKTPSSFAVDVSLLLAGHIRAAGLPVLGIHYLLGTVMLVWLMGSILGTPMSRFLTLDHSWSRWWTWVTDAFHCSTHAQLAVSLFLGYMFGRVVENTESTQGLWLTYVLSAAGEHALQVATRCQ